MSREDLLKLRGLIDAVLIERELESRRTMPAREVIESRMVPGAVLRLELLRYPDNSTAGPYWFRYTLSQADPPKVVGRYMGESLPGE
jgi:hypothetical protein